MYNTRFKNIFGNTTIRKNHRSHQVDSAQRDRFFFALPLILMVIMIWPFRLAAEDLTCSHLPKLMEVFHDNHYAMKSMTGQIKAQAVDQMIKRLDPSKTLLYESDLEKIKPLLLEVFVSAEKGNCASLQQVYSLLVARARENEAIVKKILGPAFRLDDRMELNINVDKRPFSKTVAEKQILLKKIVQFQIENSLLSGIDLATAKKQQIHRYELQTMRVVEQNPNQLITTVAEAFAGALDPHTSYLSPKNLEDLQIQMKLSLEGIGAMLSSDAGFTIIEELVPGGGAEKSGMLKPKDKIIAVAQEGEKPVNVIDMDLRDVVSMIRGKKGTRVTLTILRQGQNKDRFDLTIMRDKIDMKEQEAKITYEIRKAGSRQYRFGVIELPSFYGGEKGGKSSYEDVKSLLADARKQRVDGIVLNLSRNGGGLLDEAVRLAGLFIGKGGIVAVKDSRGQVTVLSNGSAAMGNQGNKREIIKFPAESPRSLYMGPLVVLTSRMSASASEIVAGALKDYNRAVIIGADHTYGKGSVQALMPLPWEMGGMKVTTGLYFLPGGRSTQKTGVAADVVLPGWSILEDFGEAALDYPLPAQAITPFIGVRSRGAPTWNLVDGGLITELVSKSQVRVAKDAKFTKIIKDNKEALGKKGIIQIADFRKTMKKENGGKEKETPSERRQKAREEYAPFVNESVNVLLDMVEVRSIQAIPQTSKIVMGAHGR
ncbi:MAG: S41 family peptidase [Smithellaceae bacterium]